MISFILLSLHTHVYILYAYRAYRINVEANIFKKPGLFFLFLRNLDLRKKYLVYAEQTKFE